jgi:hypothetical protein
VNLVVGEIQLAHKSETDFILERLLVFGTAGKKRKREKSMKKKMKNTKKKKEEKKMKKKGEKKLKELNY